MSMQDPEQFVAGISNPRIRRIAETVCRNEPVDTRALGEMLATDDILEIGAVADFQRRQLYGNRVFYGVNMNLNYTNICELRCPLCAFSCDPGDETAFVLSLDEIENRVCRAVDRGVDEVHIVGGLNPELDLDYFEEMIRRVRGVKKDLVIVAFTAVEYDYFARQSAMPVSDVIGRLAAAGVDALPGGGAEIFSPDVRKIIAPKKISGRQWLRIMETAHEQGLKTNATMLYNHRETIADMVDHLAAIRELQDKTGGFKTFVPLAFHGANTGIQQARAQSTGYDDIRIYAAARIFLHNVAHIKALWMYLGEKTAQVLLSFGVDELGGTYYDEKVVHSAGAQTPDFSSEARLRKIIENAGGRPVRTTALYGETT
ncbi:aminodeoxyfutalosine synthase [Desulfosalsimonas propionicica]|uniref:Aminodeoxyfutalosine synthase n=1 Tax=Desulfosalsimonas propionicica TaxID=332175 RepID=A0A7W0CAQ0_9BACT|nr:CofH family radical SAM protein [Desulfosalsimonas propionicica]MBA2882262.1 aminodeoxyfutalosine synthase [Desulfosalsimonas propionicica]